MPDIETLRELGNGQFVIPVWEVFFYMGVITLFALMGRPRSCLINTYVFTLYWGFRSLLPSFFIENGFSQTSLVLYVICGLGIYVLITIAYLKLGKSSKKASQLSC